MSILTVYPYHDGVTRGGTVITDNVGSWGTAAVDGAGFFTYDAPSTANIGYDRPDTAGTSGYWGTRRAHFILDTSALTSSAIISAATFNVKSDGTSGTTVNVYSTNPASNSALVDADHNTVGNTAFSTSASLTSGSHNSFALNASGISSVSKTSYTKLSLRYAVSDAGRTAPSYGYEAAAVYFVNYSGTSSDPYITITYTLPVAPTVTGSAASSVATTSMTGNGNITADGGATVTRRGFCYKTGTTGDPTTADSVAYDDGSFSTGAYTKSITGLTAGTSYRVRAYATNSAGTSYGTTTQEATLSGPANLKTLNGVAKASIKTINGVAIASVKTWNGVA